MDDQIEKQVQYAERASKGGAARMQKLSRAERQALASEAAKARWKKSETKPLKMNLARANRAQIHSQRPFILGCSTWQE